MFSMSILSWTGLLVFLKGVATSLHFCGNNVAFLKVILGPFTEFLESFFRKKEGYGVHTVHYFCAKYKSHIQSNNAIMLNLCIRYCVLIYTS